MHGVHVTVAQCVSLPYTVNRTQLRRLPCVASASRLLMARAAPRFAFLSVAPPSHARYLRGDYSVPTCGSDSMPCLASRPVSPSRSLSFPSISAPPLPSRVRSPAVAPSRVAHSSRHDGATHSNGTLQYGHFVKICRLTGLTLRPDFKSYKGRHNLEFGDSYFTSIVGPNGSGKSNS